MSDEYYGGGRELERDEPALRDMLDPASRRLITGIVVAGMTGTR